MGYSSWGHKESDMTERLSMYLELKRERKKKKGQERNEKEKGKARKKKEGRKEKYLGKRNANPGEQWYMII